MACSGEGFLLSGDKELDCGEEREILENASADEGKTAFGGGACRNAPARGQGGVGGGAGAFGSWGFFLGIAALSG